MADSNEYHIYLHLEELTNSSAMTGTTGSVGGEEGANPAPNASAEKVGTLAKRIVSFAAIASTADRLISYRIRRVSLETGATELEKRLSVAHSIGREVLGAAVALGTGFAAGPAGFAIALAGVAMSGINKTITISENRETLRTQQNLENISIGMYNIRAGTVGRRSKEQ